MRSLLVGFTLIVMAITAPIMAAQKVELSIDASKPGAKIDRNIFGSSPSTLDTVFMKAFGLGRIPRSRIHAGFATMWSAP